MDIDALLMKFLREKYKEFRNIPIEYNIEDAVEIIEDEEYDDLDLLIWIEDENMDKPLFFDEKDNALEYINLNNPKTIFIEFTDAILVHKTTNKLVEYITYTDDLKKDLKLRIVRLLIDKYIIDNKEFITDDLEDEVYCIEKLPDLELFERLINDEDLFHEIVSNFSFYMDMEDSVHFISPNTNFYSGKNIRFVNEVYKDFIINFHNNNFENGNLEDESVNIICEFLNSKIQLSEDYYKYYFGESIVDKKILTRTMILTIISDYYKFNYSIKDEDNYISENDKKYLKLIQNSTIQQLLLKFELDDKFSKTIVSDYLFYNQYFKDEEKKEIDDEKTLKKIDPFYKLNKITKL